MILTTAHILDLIEELPINVAFDYVSGGDSKAKLVSIDRESVKVDIVRVNADGSEKNASMTTDILNTLANSIKENKPFKFDNVLNGSGNVRSTMEAIFAHTSEFYSCKIGRVKHLIWVPRIPHEIGKIIDYDSIKDELGEILSNDSAVLNQPLQQIFFGAPGTGKSDSIDRIVQDVAHTRTTFHPDSDYASFVGAYKPRMSSSSSIQRLNLSVEDLAQKLGTYYNDSQLGKVGGIQKFCLEFYPYIDGEYMSVNITKLLELAGVSDNYGVEINKYLKFCRMLPKREDNKIVYSFTPQAFLKAYCAAWKQMPEPYFLVIEEINRGNCAQIFGDLFQLLDRNEKGYSKYEIAPDDDIRKFLSSDKKEGFGALTEEQKENFPKDSVWKGEELILPPNLYIWATMNTSDQSLFPIDSAFKRRWEWKYIKITNGYKKNENGEYETDAEGKKIPLNWKIETNGQDWYGFIQQINKIISNMTSSADKQLGYFFCQANEEKKITTETFVSKVLFYLWNDVFKDYGFDDAKLFKYKTEDGKEEDLTFPDFYDEEGSVVDDVVKQFIEHVMAWKGDDKKESN